MDAGDHAVRLSRRATGGPAGIRAPSPAAAATSRSGSSRRKNERHGLLATLWFNIAHYAVRPWPWILTALASLVLYPNLADKESGYVCTLMDPQCFRRRCAASCSPRSPPPTCRRSARSSIGARRTSSTTSTAAFCGGTAEREYVVVSQAVTVGLMLVSIYVTLHLASIEQAWKLLIVTGAGTGTVLLLRWFWWRINAWSEVSAMAVAAAVSLYLQLGLKWDSDQPRDFAYIMIVTVALTTVAWLAVTWLTPPEPRRRCDAFYRRVRPHGRGWVPIAAAVGCRLRQPSLGARAAQCVSRMRARLRCALRRGRDCCCAASPSASACCASPRSRRLPSRAISTRSAQPQAAAPRRPNVRACRARRGGWPGVDRLPIGGRAGGRCAMWPETVWTALHGCRARWPAAIRRAPRPPAPRLSRRGLRVVPAAAPAPGAWLLLDVHEGPLVVVAAAVVEANRLFLALAGRRPDAAGRCRRTGLRRPGSPSDRRRRRAAGPRSAPPPAHAPVCAAACGPGPRRAGRPAAGRRPARPARRGAARNRRW